MTKKRLTDQQLAELIAKWEWSCPIPPEREVGLACLRELQERRAAEPKGDPAIPRSKSQQKRFQATGKKYGAPRCEKCSGYGWLWGHELADASEDTRNDTMTKYPCDSELCVALRTGESQ